MRLKMTNPDSIIFLLAFLLYSLCSPAQQRVLPEERIKNIENGLAAPVFDEKFTVGQLVDRRHIDSMPKLNIHDQMKQFKIPGLTISVINDFKTDWSKGYGVMEAGTDKKVTPSTMFQTGSTTKVLMGIIILRMVEEGKLDLDKDINAYLKSWKMPVHSSGIKVTLRMLLTHQAGINRPGHGFETVPGSNPTLVEFLRGTKPVLNDSVFFENTPGTKHSYSNFGYLIMQLILEDYFGTSYSQIVKKFIFDPLNLRSSFIEYPFPAKFADRVIRPHNKEGVPSGNDGLYSAALAQAGLITTSADLAKIACELMLAYQGKSDKILSQKSAQLMFSTELKLDPAKFMGISGQGLGMFLFNFGDSQFFLHPGENSPGANCMFLGSTNSGKGVVIMTNGMDGILVALELVSSVSKEYNWVKEK